MKLLNSTIFTLPGAAVRLVIAVWFFLSWAMLPNSLRPAVGLCFVVLLYLSEYCTSRWVLRCIRGGAFFFAVLAALLLSRPVSKGYYVVGAAIKDVVRASVLPNSLSKSELIRSIIGVDLYERLLGDKAHSTAHLGHWEFKAQNASVMKSLLIDIFLRQDYLYPVPVARKPFIIDCGGNVGFTVLYFKLQYPDARMLVFEPDPQNFVMLQDNLQRAGFADVELKKLAVADKEGTLNFFASTVGGHIATAGDEGTIAVEAVRLSQFINEPVDILKMDIEGAETLVLRDLDASGKIENIKNIIMEFHYNAVDLNALGEVLSMLERRNFRYHIEALPGMTPSFNGSKSVDSYLRCLMIYATKQDSKSV